MSGERPLLKPLRDPSLTLPCEGREAEYIAVLIWSTTLHTLHPTPCPSLYGTQSRSAIVAVPIGKLYISRCYQSYRLGEMDWLFNSQSKELPIILSKPNYIFLLLKYWQQEI